MYDFYRYKIVKKAQSLKYGTILSQNHRSNNNSIIRRRQNQSFAIKHFIWKIGQMERIAQSDWDLHVHKIQFTFNLQKIQVNHYSSTS